MFQFETEMIPVLKDCLSRKYHTKYFTTEFNTGNGVADLVFSKELNDEPLIFNDYGLMALFVTHFYNNKVLKRNCLFENCNDKLKLKRLLDSLERHGYLTVEDNYIIQTKKYKPHAPKMISIEAKLKDWKSGLNQALRYQFFSHKSFLAYPKNNIHRVDINLLKLFNIGLISVSYDEIEIIINPIEKKPQDVISHYFLSESFARNVKRHE